MLRNSRSRIVFTFLALAIGVSASFAAAPDRIAAQISAGNRAPLAGSVHPKVKSAADLGAAPAGKQLTSMSLRFNMTPAQQSALDQLLIDQQNPASPQYHQWLTPAQYGAQFGLGAADIAKVTAWLTGEGLTVTGVANSSTFVTFNGTVAQVNAAFGTSIHSLTLNGEAHYANVGEVTLPSSLAGVVTAVTGLHDFRLKSRIRKNGFTTLPTPAYTTSTGGVTSHYLAPGDFYTIYDENSLLTSSINGSGVTIAVMGQVDISLSDIASFRTAFGLPANVPAIKVYGTDPGPAECSVNCTPSEDDLEESSLDVEWSGAVAQAASILFVTSQDVIDISLTQAIDNNLAPIMTISYGDCESGWGATEMSALNAVFKQGSAQGITILGPAGDDGATDCDSTVPAQFGLNVDFPASSPFVTGVGGTMFNEGAGTYWSATNGTTGGSALSYIPETPWNETVIASVNSSLISGGGGSSAFFLKPAWQTGTGVPADGARDVPDVSLDAGAIHDGYLVCVSGSCPTQYSVAGGTSFATPQFAGMLALVEQKIGGKIGLANPTLYALANNSSYYSSVFHDITTGNNSQPCEIGSTGCPTGGLIGYSANVGYDLATGWGTLDAANLVNDWKLVTPIATGTASNASTTTVTASPVSPVTAGTSVLVTATVVSGTAGVTATPTGTVRFLLQSATTGLYSTLATATALSGGTASYTLSTTGLASGTYSVAASYSGDSNYASSLSVDALVDVVSATSPDFKLTPVTASLTTTPGGTTSGMVYTVTPINGFTGTVTFQSELLAGSLDANYAFSPTSVTFTSASTAAQTTTFSLVASQTALRMLPGGGPSGMSPAAMASGSAPVGHMPWYAAGSGVTLAGLLMFALPRRRRLGALLLAVLAVGLIFGASGCGTSNMATATGGTTTSTGTTTINASPGTYTLEVTAYNSTGTIVHSTLLTFVVQ